MGNSGRRAYNQTNQEAKKVKAELEEMHKTVTQMGTAVALSQQRGPPTNSTDCPSTRSSSRTSRNQGRTPAGRLKIFNTDYVRDTPTSWSTT